VTDMAIASRFDFGDVVLVPFRFTDQSGTKKRLAIAAPDAVRMQFLDVDRGLDARCQPVPENSPSRATHNRCFQREWRGFCEMATQNPTQSKVRREPQEVALARGLQAQRQPGSRRTEHPDRISSLRIMSLPGIPARKRGG